MDTQSTLKLPEKLEELVSDDSFLKELASFFAHRQMRALDKVPRVISLYSMRDNYNPILRKFLEYLNIELAQEFKNGEGDIRPRVIISKDDEPNTYSVQLDFFVERKKMPGLPLTLNPRCGGDPIYYTITPVNSPKSL